MFRLTCFVKIAIICGSINSGLATIAVELPTTSLQALPSEITLNGPRGVQQLIVTANAEAATIHDATNIAEYKSDDAAVALIEAGKVRDRKWSHHDSHHTRRP